MTTAVTVGDRFWAGPVMWEVVGIERLNTVNSNTSHKYCSGEAVVVVTKVFPDKPWWFSKKLERVKASEVSSRIKMVKRELRKVGYDLHEVEKRKELKEKIRRRLR